MTYLNIFMTSNLAHVLRPACPAIFIHFLLRYQPSSRPADLGLGIAQLGHGQGGRAGHHRGRQEVIRRDVEGDVGLGRSWSKQIRGKKVIKK